PRAPRRRALRPRAPARGRRPGRLARPDRALCRPGRMGARGRRRRALRPGWPRGLPPPAPRRRVRRLVADPLERAPRSRARRGAPRRARLPLAPGAEHGEAPQLRADRELGRPSPGAAARDGGAALQAGTRGPQARAGEDGRLGRVAASLPAPLLPPPEHARAEGAGAGEHPRPERAPPAAAAPRLPGAGRARARAVELEARALPAGRARHG